MDRQNNNIDMFFITAIMLFTLLITMIPVRAKVIKAGVQESTPVNIVAEWPINESTHVGEHFSARIIEDIISDHGELYIPKGSRVVGVVTEIEGAKSFHRNGKVDIKFQRIIFPDNITSIEIGANGEMIKDTKAGRKTLGDGVAKASGGALLGAMMGLRFGGILGTGAGSASNLAIGAMTGAGISLISFIGKKGQEVEINPGLPMMLNITNMEQQDYIAQDLAYKKTKRVNAEILSIKGRELEIAIDNKLNKDIPLTNLKIVDGLGYTIKPNIPMNYHDMKSIPAGEKTTYKFDFNPTTKKARYWVVLTDSFHKEEYFRKELTF